MEKIKQAIPMAMLLSFLTKLLFITPSFADMGILFALACLVGLDVYVKNKEDISAIKDIVNKQNDVIQTSAIEIAKMKTIVEGVRLKNEFKQADVLRKLG